ncbi:MAG: glycosyltransferase family 2 protein [Opitutales bacterium]|nr:glycosyltransferase family 2 protein [Opitutales bacterium]
MQGSDQSGAGRKTGSEEPVSTAAGLSSSEALDLTIVIPTLNEAGHLSGCLDAIGSDFAKRVVVLDSGSTDGTRQLADRPGVDWLDFQWNGRFPKKRNWFLREHPPATGWVLFLDADEYLTPYFKQELRRVLPDSVHVGFWLRYTVFFLGRRLKGGYPMKKLALFRVGSGEYEKIEEDHWSALDMEVHEHPVLAGSIGIIHSKIDHRDMRGIGPYMAKHAEYASWEAARYLKCVNDPEIRASWTWKQKLKYRLIRTPFAGVVYFFGSYFCYGGWLDGSAGLAFALLKMSYFTRIYCRIRELDQGSGKRC